MSLRSALSRLLGSADSNSDSGTRRIGVEEVRALQDGGAVLLDVRSPQEFRAGRAPGAKNIPVDQLADRVGEIPVGSTVLTFCQSGGRSARAARVLADHGRQDVHDVCGGMAAWQRAGLPVQGRS